MGSDESQSEEPMEDSDLSRHGPEFNLRRDWSRVSRQYLRGELKVIQHKQVHTYLNGLRAARRIQRFGNYFHKALTQYLKRHKALTRCLGNRRCRHSMHIVAKVVNAAHGYVEFHMQDARVIEAASHGLEKHIAKWQHEAALCGRGRACNRMWSLVKKLKTFGDSIEEFVTLWREYVARRNKLYSRLFPWATGHRANQMIKLLKRCPRRECHDAQSAAYNLVKIATNVLRRKPLDKNVLIPQLKRDEQLVLKLLHHDRRGHRRHQDLKFLSDLKQWRHFLSYHSRH